MAVAEPTTSTTSTAQAPRLRPWLGWFALAVVVGMQAGTVFRPLGAVGETRLADWVDLLTPFAVLGTAAVVLQRARATSSQWWLFGFGGVAFALGKGLHLAANSVSNVADPAVANADVVHLWDEVVSHLVWYTGLFVVLLALAMALRGVSLEVGPVDLVVAGLVAVTLTNNYIEGGMPVLGLLFLATLFGTGLRSRPDPVSRLLLAVGGTGLVLLVGWGAYWYLADGSSFPQFSELGWI